MLFIILSITGILILTYVIFVNFYPSFGGKVTKELKKEYAKSKNHNQEQFVNEKDVPKNLSFAETLGIMRKFFFTKVPNGSPDNPLTVKKIDSTAIADYNEGTRLIWFGHSAFLLQINGKNILIDPMLSDVPAPHPWLGSGRFNKELPIAIAKLPKIDAVLISHDHYDHLDYESIRKLKGKVGHFYVPLGVSVHLKAWGVSSAAITEMDWWQEEIFNGLTFVCTPAQHFSGRRFNDRQSTLWGSWVIQSKVESIFFSGDSGYSDHFKVIGEKYGPFDFAMMECGQYNESWPDIHMFPEETVQAGIDVRAKYIMPIHWGGFKLSLHSWTDPVERATKKSKALNVNLITPRIGESIILTELSAQNSSWWSN